MVCKVELFQDIFLALLSLLSCATYVVETYLHLEHRSVVETRLIEYAISTWFGVQFFVGFFSAMSKYVSGSAIDSLAELTAAIRRSYLLGGTATIDFVTVTAAMVNMAASWASWTEWDASLAVGYGIVWSALPAAHPRRHIRRWHLLLRCASLARMFRSARTLSSATDNGTLNLHNQACFYSLAQPSDIN